MDSKKIIAIFVSFFYIFCSSGVFAENQKNVCDSLFSSNPHSLQEIKNILGTKFDSPSSTGTPAPGQKFYTWEFVDTTPLVHFPMTAKYTVYVDANENILSISPSGKCPQTVSYSPELNPYTIVNQWKSFILNLSSCSAGTFILPDINLYVFSKKIVPVTYKISGMENNLCNMSIIKLMKTNIPSQSYDEQICKFPKNIIDSEIAWFNTSVYPVYKPANGEPLTDFSNLNSYCDDYVIENGVRSKVKKE